MRAAWKYRAAGERSAKHANYIRSRIHTDIECDIPAALSFHQFTLFKVKTFGHVETFAITFFARKDIRGEICVKFSYVIFYFTFCIPYIFFTPCIYDTRKRGILFCTRYRRKSWTDLNPAVCLKQIERNLIRASKCHSASADAASGWS